MTCPYCHSEMIYTGIDDGLGDYGDSACDVYRCEECDHEEVGDCIGGGEGEEWDE